MSEAQVHVERFLSRLREAEEQLRVSRLEVENREEKISLVLRQMVSNMSSKHDVSKSSPQLQQLLGETTGTLQAAVKEWQRAVEAQIRQREFVSKFDKSLIVMVYGKVKSGKSSLGNFIAGLDFKRFGIASYDKFPVKITVHETAEKSHDAERLMELCDGFEVKATEATNCIQEFTLGGMSWVDTPGIDALTEQNVVLAKQYIENAELAVFLSSSDAPMRSGDLQALTGLLRKSIPTLLVISKFDEVEEDEDPATGEIVSRTIVKGNENRRQQQEWVGAQIREAGLEKTFHGDGCLFISTKVAKDALAIGDSTEFETSGLPLFYDRLGAIVSDEAISLKAHKPRARVNALIEEVLNRGLPGTGSLVEFQSSFEGLAGDFRARREALCALGPKLARQIHVALTVPLRELLQEAEQAFESESYEKKAIERKLNKILTDTAAKVVSQELTRALRESLGDLVRTLSTATEANIGIGDLSRLTETLKVSDSTLKEGVGSAIGATAGAAAGMLAGPFAPVAVPVLSILGGWLGNLGGKAVSGTKDLEVQVGLNTEQVRAKIDLELAELLPIHTAKLLQGVCDTWFDPLIQVADDAVDGVRKAQNELEKLKFEGVS